MPRIPDAFDATLRAERPPIDRTRSQRPEPRSTLALSAAAALLLALACNEPIDPDSIAIEGARKPQEVLDAQAAAQREAAGAIPERAGRQILFGDLHVHTTYSFDGYLFSLPIMGGEGAHPPNDACDFARYCSNLDFYSLTDHAESLSPAAWQKSKESVRQCNARAGDPNDPDLVAFMGYEWSQAGLTPEDHFGHRCLVFPGQADDELPPRPIGFNDNRPSYQQLAGRISQMKYLDPLNWGAYTAYAAWPEKLMETPVCEEGVDTMDLPLDCHEVAPTPRELHEKLSQWGGPVLEIPHGTAWGVYTPQTTTIAKHLEPQYFDPKRQQLIEVMSGHGNSEEYRRWREWTTNAEGEPVCPAPTKDYLPCCWQAGELMRGRCGDLPAEECERRVELAREYSMLAVTRPNQIFPDADPEEWLDCGQCRDCFKPSYGLRPRESVQYAMSLSHPEARAEDGRPLRFRYGFIASSDIHSARPGTGYKAVDRAMMTDTNNVGGAAFSLLTSLGGAMDDPQMPVKPSSKQTGVSGNDGRVQAFLYPGGLAAVHADSRRREDVWAAMQRREVFGTSGPRILLWFDHLRADGTRHPMGSELDLEPGTAPSFEVRAVGSFEPKPGCPDWAKEGLPAERLARLCHDECYHPSDQRRRISGIEIIRIRPQQRAGEDVDPLIEDPWRRFECGDDPSGCTVRFDDPEMANAPRDVLYYARALEESVPTISGNPLRTRFDAEGGATEIELCDLAGDCLDPAQERAWSSPIFLNVPRPRIATR